MPFDPTKLEEFKQTLTVPIPETSTIQPQPSIPKFDPAKLESYKKVPEIRALTPELAAQLRPPTQSELIKMAEISELKSRGWPHKPLTSWQGRLASFFGGALPTEGTEKLREIYPGAAMLGKVLQLGAVRQLTVQKYLPLMFELAKWPWSLFPKLAPSLLHAADVGATWGIGGIIDIMAKEPSKETITHPLGEAAFGSLLGATHGVLTTRGRIAAGALARGGWAAGQELLKDWHIDKQDLTNIGLNAALGAFFEAIDAPIVSREYRAARTGDFLEQQIIKEARRRGVITTYEMNRQLNLLDRFTLATGSPVYVLQIKDMPVNLATLPKDIQSKYAQNIVSNIYKGSPVIDAVRTANSWLRSVTPVPLKTANDMLKESIKFQERPFEERVILGEKPPALAPLLFTPSGLPARPSNIQRILETPPFLRTAEDKVTIKNFSPQMDADLYLPPFQSKPTEVKLTEPFVGTKREEVLKEQVDNIANIAAKMYHIPTELRADVVSEIAKRMVEKVGNWSPDKGSLQTYLIGSISPQISTIVQELKAPIKIPRPALEDLSKYNQAMEGLRARLGREPTPEEEAGILKSIGMTKKTLNNVLRAKQTLSLYEPVAGSEETVLQDLIQDPRTEPDIIAENVIKSQLEDFVTQLEPQVQKVIRMTFGFTPERVAYSTVRIAQELNISRQEVERLKTIGLNELSKQEPIAIEKSRRLLRNLQMHSGVALRSKFGEQLQPILRNVSDILRFKFREFIQRPFDIRPFSLTEKALKRLRIDKTNKTIALENSKDVEEFKENERILKESLNPLGPPEEILSPEEMAEAIRKMPKPKLYDYITSQYIVLSRHLKVPEIARWMSDALMFKKFLGDERRNQFHRIVSLVWGQDTIPEGDFPKLQRVLEGREIAPAQWQPFVIWWKNLAQEMHTAINEVRQRLGMKPIEKVENYLHRRLNNIARSYLDGLRKIRGDGIIGDIPPEVLNVIRFAPTKRTMIPMIYERTIEDPEVIRNWINEERAKKGLAPIESIYETDPNRLILATIYAESGYPYLMDALDKIYKRKRTLPPESQAWIERWLRHQILNRPAEIDITINNTIEPITKLAKTVGIDLGRNPAATINRLFGRLIHLGAIGFNIPLAGLNFLQITHGVGLAGVDTTVSALTSLRFKEAKELLNNSRVLQGRYPFETLKPQNLTFIENLANLSMGAYQAADWLTTSTNFLAGILNWYKTNPEFRNKIKPFLSPSLRGTQQIIDGINKATKAGIIWDDLYRADYFTYVGQYPYLKEFAMAMTQKTPTQALMWFKTWPVYYATGFMPELIYRAVEGKDTLGNRIRPIDRLGLLSYLLVLSVLVTGGALFDEKTREYIKRSYPMQVIGEFFRIGASYPYELIINLSNLFGAYLSNDEKNMKRYWNEVLRQRALLIPGGVAFKMFKKEKAEDLGIDLDLPEVKF
jgi:RNA polymerase sigma factor (sigma-70 family)